MAGLQSPMQEHACSTQLFILALDALSLCSPFPSPEHRPNPGIEPRSPALQAILYQLNHKGSPRTLGWVASFSADLPDPGIEPGSPALQAILYQLSYQGSPGDVEWFAHFFLTDKRFGLSLSGCAGLRCAARTPAACRPGAAGAGTAAPRRMGPQLPDERLSPRPLHCKVGCSPLDHQGRPWFSHFG